LFSFEAEVSVSQDPDTPHDTGPARGVSNKTMEVIAALFVLALGAVGVKDSLRLGMRWADDGPQAGYFPFYVSAIMCACALWILVRALMRGNPGVFLTRNQAIPVLKLFIPLAVYTVLIALLGIYVASVIFIAYCMKTMGGYGWLKSIGIPVAVMGFFFVVFELWFKLPLPKGPLENLLGLA
jgi:hypothetical protein